mmetsp:Transcript_1303/g.4851  ORF Transcript_1303/g.4851 Transcript_1303/m.4851 type:complete len:238 (-) Transcript_1303:1432-2145(-)
MATSRSKERGSLGGGFGGPSGGRMDRGIGGRGGSNMMLLGTPNHPKGGRSQRSMVTATGPAKLTVPKPVNLPSRKLEFAGNDPATQLVPSQSIGGWRKDKVNAPEGAAANAPVVTSALTTEPITAGWASSSTSVGRRMNGEGARLNSREFPSLSEQQAPQDVGGSGGGGGGGGHASNIRGSRGGRNGGGKGGGGGGNHNSSEGGGGGGGGGGGRRGGGGGAQGAKQVFVQRGPSSAA